MILRLTRCADRSKETRGAVLQQFADAGFKERIKLCLTDMYEGYVVPLKTYLPQAVHQFCWFHINCFHIGAAVHRAERAYQRAVEALATFDKHHPAPLTEVACAQRRALFTTQEQAHRQWLGAQRCQHLLLRLLWSPSLAVATARLAQLLRVAPKLTNPHIQAMATFLAQHRAGLLAFYTCLASGRHLLQRLSRSQAHWVALTTRWAIPITTNAAEHVFRCLRRYTNTMDHFGADEATQRFFDLFAFFHNVHLLRAGRHAGNSLLATAQVDVKALFGVDDPYTMLGFPPAGQAFSAAKRPVVSLSNHVQSVAAWHEAHDRRREHYPKGLAADVGFATGGTHIAGLFPGLKQEPPLRGRGMGKVGAFLVHTSIMPHFPR